MSWLRWAENTPLTGGQVGLIIADVSSPRLAIGPRNTKAAFGTPVTAWPASQLKPVATTARRCSLTSNSMKELLPLF